MSTAFENLIQHLDECSVDYQTDIDGQSISAVFGGEVGRYPIKANVAEDAALFQVRGYSPVIVPPGARCLIAETIARANHGLFVGKFEMDFDDGELQFQAAQILTDDSIHDEVIEGVCFARPSRRCSINTCPLSCR